MFSVCIVTFLTKIGRQITQTLFPQVLATSFSIAHANPHAKSVIICSGVKRVDHSPERSGQ